MQSVIEKGLAVVLVVMRCRLKEDAKCTHDSMSALIGKKAKQKCGVKKQSPEKNSICQHVCLEGEVHVSKIQHHPLFTAGLREQDSRVMAMM